jgi:hypothetical protein
VISTAVKTATAAIGIAAALGATTVQAASVKSGDAVRVAGTCSDTSSSKLKVKRDNRHLQVEFEVDQNRAGVPWTVELRKDGRLVFHGTRTTLAPSGSFSVERRIAGTTGVLTASATRAGEGCAATVKAAKTVKGVTPAGPATAAKPGAEDNPERVSDDNGNHVNDDNTHHGSDGSGHHGNDD